MLHTKRLRVEENDIITHYYAANTYYNREKLRDVIREALQSSVRAKQPGIRLRDTAGFPMVLMHT